MDREPSERADVCVVGAGPAGALVASRLASDGYDVVVLEAGPRFEFDEREARMERAIRPGDEGSVWEMGGERDEFSASGEQYYPLNVARVKGVGGSTLHWQGMVMRLHPTDFEGGHDNDDPAWPVGYDDLRPYYADAERALGVAGDADNPFAPPRDGPYPLPGFPPSYSDSLFAEACERLGIATHSVPNARNSEAYDGRGPCVGYGTCQPVCPSGAKYDASVHIEDAEDEGARVVDRAPVQRLETDRDGRVEAAVYATPDGREHRQTAREFVVAAGGVETPRLLLLSRSQRHRDGLANESGLVGHYFMEHLFAGAGGTLDRRTRQNHVGFITSECHQFYDDPGQAVGRGDGETVLERTDEALSPIKLEFLNYAGPSPVELALGGEEWGDALLSDLREAYGNSIAMGGLVGQPPRKANRVTLDPSTTDDHGNPVPDIRWSWGERTKRSLARANELQHAVLDELGVDISWTVGPGNTGPAYHHMGTTRMGVDPDESVVNPQLRTHDVSNLSVASSSVFVTAGSMNPTLTIAALALKCADHVRERL
ncbi:GMC family oxidoreductase [Haloarcula salina]|uniref:GMC family oxidoreductase n=1 Tax=Haloarcula salina TaxID=1429914 RepID=A0AA41G0C7_9EURY|nr:GMC family oxidoreductase [Haloarcula salina]MBV0901199.1 GMC family oxidoreductase [Haloarcula salina]